MFIAHDSVMPIGIEIGVFTAPFDIVNGNAAGGAALALKVTDIRAFTLVHCDMLRDEPDNTAGVVAMFDDRSAHTLCNVKVCIIVAINSDMVNFGR